jgi:STE24 endopeptidase
MNPQTILLIILALFVANFLFDQVLSWLNLRHHSRELPEKLKGRYDEEKYAKSYDYHVANYRFSLVQSIPGFFITGAILLFGGLGWLDAQLRTITEHPIALPLLYFGVLLFISDLISLPFQLYGTFVIEEKFGFNKTTPKTFVLDKIKGWLLGIVIGGIVLGALLWLVDLLGSGFWLWFWGFITVFMIFMSEFYTSWFLPLFNKLSPLEEGDLRTAIEEYAHKTGFPLQNVFVMDGSKRSAKSNAFFSGLGKRKKIVLYDTLIENHNTDELVAILAHETGHYKKKHTRQGLILGILQTGLTLFILSLFVKSEALSLALGATQYGVHLNLIAFGLLYSPISMVVGIGMNLLSRKNEYEADRYAAETWQPGSLQEALIRLHADNLSNLTPHPLNVFLNYSHPTLMQRLEKLG